MADAIDPPPISAPPANDGMFYVVNRVTSTRAATVRAFSALPDEAFSYFCGVIYSISRSAGGFQSDSRAAIEALGLVALDYLSRPVAPPEAPTKK